MRVGGSVDQSARCVIERVFRGPIFARKAAKVLERKMEAYDCEIRDTYSHLDYHLDPVSVREEFARE